MSAPLGNCVGCPPARNNVNATAVAGFAVGCALVALVVRAAFSLVFGVVSAAVILAPSVAVGVVCALATRHALIVRRVRSFDVDGRRGGPVGVVHDGRSGHGADESRAPFALGVRAGSSRVPFAIDEGGMNPLAFSQVIEAEVVE